MGEMIAIRGNGALLEPNSALPDWLRQRINSLTNDYPPKLPANMALSEAQRFYCQRCLTSLKSHFEPATEHEIAVVVAKLQAAFPAADVASSVAEVGGEAYLIALEGVPLWALEEAYRRVLRGEAAVNRQFMPKPPELRFLVNEISRPARWQAKRIEHLLEAISDAQENRCSIERFNEIRASVVLELPEARRRHPRNPANVDHSNKAGW